MATTDVVKCKVCNKEFVYKFPSDDLRIGTQLVFTPQTAFFVKGSMVLDEYKLGTGGGIGKARTRGELPKSCEVSHETIPRLRQTACCTQADDSTARKSRKDRTLATTDSIRQDLRSRKSRAHKN